MSFSLAALLDFHCDKFAANGEYEGQRGDNNQTYPIRDNAENLAIMNEAWKSTTEAAQVAPMLLADTRLWGENLALVPGLVEQVSTALARIQTVGIKTAMNEL